MICHKCKRDLPEDSFAWQRKGVRRQYICRECFSKYNAERYKKKQDKIKAQVTEYRRNNPETAFNTRLKTCEKNPTKYNANKLIAAALAADKIVKPHECSICGCSDKDRRIEAHHEDYAKPLDVIWACTPCHRKMDAKRREREGLKAYPVSVAVQQIDDDGNIIAEYKSCKEAADAVNRKPNSISQAINRPCKCAGYNWRRKE